MKKSIRSPEKLAPRKVHFAPLAKKKTYDNESSIYKQSHQNDNKISLTRNYTNKLHGTANYINGTLNFSSSDLKVGPILNQNKCNGTDMASDITIVCRNQLTNDGSTIPQQKKYSLNQNASHEKYSRCRILLNVQINNDNTDKCQGTNKIRKFTSNYFSRAKKRILNCSKRSTNSEDLFRIEYVDRTKEDLAKPFKYRLVSIEPHKKEQRFNSEIQEKTNQRSLIAIENAFNNQDKLNYRYSEKNLNEILALAHRWQSPRLSTPVIHLNSSRCCSLVETCTSKNSDAKL